ncbi:MAG: TIGR03619 family F420-dependent LLM class oxidoreductase [Pseudomonadales bacterium]
MKFWQAITWAETEQLPEIAKFAEEVGFYGLMGGDHAVYPETIAAKYPYSDDGLPPMQPDWEYPDQWVSMAAMAAVTKKIKFTTGVYVLPARNPHEVARATATLAILSDNRFVLGVGAGWMKEEFNIYGIDFRRRGKRLDECIEVLRKLWQGGMVEHHGEFYDFPRVQLSPAPSTAPPVYVGGANPAALRRAAFLGDGWIGAGNMAAEIPGVIGELNALRQQAGRDHLPFETMIGVKDTLSVDLLKRLQDQGMTSTVSYPFSFALGLCSSLDDKKRFMEEFARAFIQPLV